MTAWKLIIEDDAGKTIAVPLARDEITIGRKEGNTIRLTERNVSRFHARLTRQNGQVFIQDCESYTGVRINGDRIRGRVEVREGDLIEIGDYHLALQAEGAQPALAGAQPAPATQPAVPGSAVSVTDFVDEEDGDHDEFAGDTQRWEPPSEMDSPLGALPTEEGSALLLDTETQRYSAPLVDDPTREETARIDSSDPTFPGGGAVAPAPISALDQAPNPFSLDDETQRTPSVPGGAPVGNPALEPQTLPAGSLPGAASALLSDDDDTLATPVAASLMADPEERTEAVRVAPGIEDMLLERPRLVALNTVFAGTVLPFDQDQMVIGRTEDNDLVIQHKSVSRNHARIVREGERWRMQDLGSANGILVNNAEVEGALLSSGDVVELGRVRLRFVAPGESFELSPDEIARARVADASGEEWDDAGTYITAAGGKKLAGASKRSPLVAIAFAAGALVLIVVAVLLLVGSGAEEGAPADPAQATGEAAPRAMAVAPDRPAEEGEAPEDAEPEPRAEAKAPAAQKAPAPAAVKAEAQPARRQNVARTDEREAAALEEEDTVDDREQESVRRTSAARRAPKRTPPKRAQVREQRQEEPKKSPEEIAAEVDALEKQATQALFTGNAASAAKYLEDARKLSPRRATLYRGLGQAYEKLGREKKAAWAYETYLKYSPGAPDRDLVRKKIQELGGS